MSKKKIGIAAAALAVLGLAVLFLHAMLFPAEYRPADDEIALRIQLATKEDFGLLVYDYTAGGHTYSGGTSNVDGSLIRHDAEIMVVLGEKELNGAAAPVELSMQFRIITDYVTPNYENVYPDAITKYMEPLSWNARPGETYSLVITGDRANGYQAALKQE